MHKKRSVSVFKSGGVIETKHKLKFADSMVKHKARAKAMQLLKNHPSFEQWNKNKKRVKAARLANKMLKKQGYNVII